MFFTDPSGHAIVQHADDSPVTPDHPAQPGEVVAAYGTNLTDYSIDVANAPPLGSPSPIYPLAAIINIADQGISESMGVSVNGIGAEIQFAGLAPGLIGVFQINFQVPQGIPNGDTILQAVRTTCSQIQPATGCQSALSVGATLPVEAKNSAH